MCLDRALDAIHQQASKTTTVSRLITSILPAKQTTTDQCYNNIGDISRTQSK